MLVINDKGEGGRYYEGRRLTRDGGWVGGREGGVDGVRERKYECVVRCEVSPPYQSHASTLPCQRGYVLEAERGSCTQRSSQPTPTTAGSAMYLLHGNC